MSLSTFTIPPDEASYAVSDGSTAIRTQLSGGAGRYRADIAGASNIVDVAWTTGPDGYEYTRIFYKTILVNGSLPFLIWLILDKPYLTKHMAFFIPSSLKLTSVSGHTYKLTAQLEVLASEIDPNYSEDYVSVYNEFGFLYNEKQFNEIVNLLLPDIF